MPEPAGVHDVGQETDGRSKSSGNQVGARNTRIFILCLAILCAVILAITATVTLGRGDGGRSAEMTSNEAVVAAQETCKGAVKKGLKAPSTAVWSGVGGVASDDGAGGYTVRTWGTVESENEFGGMVSHQWECTATIPPGDDGTISARVTSLG